MPPRQEINDHTTLMAAGRAAFPDFQLRSLARTRSTQDVARRAARNGASAGYCCIAAEQTAGRGRLNRPWLAPPGAALLTSVVLRPQGEAMRGVTLAAGLAVVDAIAIATGVAARVRWPNDVVVGGAKLAGVLAEVEPAGDKGPAVVLGIGVNLTVDRLPDGIEACSLHDLVAPPPTAQRLLAELLPALVRRLEILTSGGIPALLPDWRHHAEGLGREVRRPGPGAPIAGTALDIDVDGALLVRTAAGKVVRLIGGDVELAAEKPAN